MYKTILARILNKQTVYNKDFFHIITLVKLPRESIRVYTGDLTIEQFESLKEDAAFILLQQNTHQLPVITKVIKPDGITAYKHAV